MRFPVTLMFVLGLAASANADSIYCSERSADCSDRIEFTYGGEVTITSGARIWRGGHTSAGTGIPFRIIDGETVLSIAAFRELDDDTLILSFSDPTIDIQLEIYRRQK